jgi:hypothetical protein
MERANICLRNSGQDKVRQGAIYTSQAVRDPVQRFMLGICTRGAFRLLPMRLTCEITKASETWTRTFVRLRFSLFGRPDLEPPSALPSAIALALTGIGTNTCRFAWGSHSYVLTSLKFVMA